jgi:hypothetical protein
MQDETRLASLARPLNQHLTWDDWNTAIPIILFDVHPSPTHLHINFPTRVLS